MCDANQATSFVVYNDIAFPLLQVSPYLMKHYPWLAHVISNWSVNNLTTVEANPPPSVLILTPNYAVNLNINPWKQENFPIVAVWGQNELIPRCPLVRGFTVSDYLILRRYWEWCDWTIAASPEGAWETNTARQPRGM